MGKKIEVILSKLYKLLNSIKIINKIMSLSCLNRIKRTSGSRPQAAADIQIIRFRIDRSGSMCSMKQEAIMEHMII